MIDVEVVDKLFEVGRASGCPMQFKLFDKRVLLPLGQLSEAVDRETRETVSEDDLHALASEGWFPLLSGAGISGEERGSPLYVPARVGLLLRLQRDGYSADELRLVAELEEWSIDNILTTEDLAYLDEDLEVLILHTESRIDALEHSVDGEGQVGRTGPDYDEAQRELAFFRRLQMNGIPDRLKPKIEKHAFRVKAFNDILRVRLLDNDRQKISAGYSPFVEGTSQTWTFPGGFKTAGIRWAATIQGAMAYGTVSDPPPIRVPGFLLRGSKVVPTRTLRPVEYAHAWKEHDLDQYLEAWAGSSGERCCLNCFNLLPEGAAERKRFCGERCRNAAKQRRFRERNPEAAERAQMKYWQSLDGEG